MEAIGGLKKFVSSDEIDAARKLRQEEWEKVRKPEDPEEVPEEAYDSRCLFDKLEQQKQKKQDDLDEKHRFSNQVKVLDDDEADFLDLVSEKQEAIKRLREAEDTQVLAEYRMALLSRVTPGATTSAAAKPTSASHKSSPNSGTKKSQLSLLAGAVKRKSTDVSSVETSEKKCRSEPSRTEEESTERTSDSLETQNDATQISDEPISSQKTAHVIGVLPGLGAYSESSESESSSDSDLELPPDIFQCKKIILAHNSAS